MAASRPLTDTQTVRRGERKGEVVAELKPETVTRLQAVGRERALIYKTLVLTGLRKNELATLTVGHGTLTLGTTAGLTFAAGHGNNTGSVEATGTLADLNAALATLTYRGVQDFNGSDTLHLTLNDNDAGGALQASAEVPIVVTPVNDAPTVTAGKADHDLVEAIPFDPGVDSATVTLTSAAD